MWQPGSIRTGVWLWLRTRTPRFVLFHVVDRVKFQEYGGWRRCRDSFARNSLLFANADGSVFTVKGTDDREFSYAYLNNGLTIVTGSTVLQKEKLGSADILGQVNKAAEDKTLASLDSFKAFADKVGQHLACQRLYRCCWCSQFVWTGPCGQGSRTTRRRSWARLLKISFGAGLVFPHRLELSNPGW